MYCHGQESYHFFLTQDSISPHIYYYLCDIFMLVPKLRIQPYFASSTIPKILDLDFEFVEVAISCLYCNKVLVFVTFSKLLFLKLHDHFLYQLRIFNDLFIGNIFRLDTDICLLINCDLLNHCFLILYIQDWASMQAILEVAKSLGLGKGARESIRVHNGADNLHADSHFVLVPICIGVPNTPSLQSSI